jgi:hypothetical protein
VCAVRGHPVACDVQSLHALWAHLKLSARHLGFSLHRFSLSFERLSQADRLVDLVICAESFFLGDMDGTSELKFRCSARAAKFLAHPSYNQLEISQWIGQAYNVRSTIVHTGSAPSTVKLPNGQKATLLEFTDQFEQLMRVALTQAAYMDAACAQLRTSQYWNQLLFP